MYVCIPQLKQLLLQLLLNLFVIFHFCLAGTLIFGQKLTDYSASEQRFDLRDPQLSLRLSVGWLSEHFRCVTVLLLYL